MGLARPGFRTPGRIANDFSAAAAVCWPGPTNWAKARRLADLQVAPEAPSAGSPRFPGPPSVAPELTRPGIEAQDASCPGIVSLRQPWGQWKVQGVAGAS